MVFLKKIWSQLNIVAQCKKNGIALWQCPQFLFLVMGVIIFATTLFSYLIGVSIIVDPEVVALVVIIMTLILLIIAFIITRSFEKLADVSRLKSEFISIVSHQLRSPLTNIKWTFEVLSSNTFKVALNKKEEYFLNVSENIKRMVELIDDLLIVSKIEEGAFSINKKEIVIDDFVVDLTNRYKIFAESSKIYLTFKHDESIKTIMADKSMLKIVLENLIDNSIRYTKGGGKIDVRITRKNKDILFSVKDQGVGIPTSDKKFIFEKFFRAENALKSTTKGSGLGLYVCRSIVLASGGKIWFESEENKGTTMYFTLPS